MTGSRDGQEAGGPGGSADRQAQEEARTCMRQGSALTAQGRIEQALEQLDRALELWEELRSREGGEGLAMQAAQTQVYRALALGARHRQQEAVAALDEAIAIFQDLDRRWGGGITYYLAMTHGNKAARLEALGDLPGALEQYDRTLELLDRWIHQEDRLDQRGELAAAMLRRAGVLGRMDQEEEARSEALAAARILEDELHRTGRSDLREQLEEVRRMLGS